VSRPIVVHVLRSRVCELCAHNSEAKDRKAREDAEAAELRAKHRRELAELRAKREAS
jgi:hypothetical protein